VLSSAATHAPLSYGSSRLTFSQSDVLDPKHSSVAWKNSHLVTMMFVLNELVQESKARALAFLSRLVAALRPGALLLVVDSAGDFSQLSLGKGTVEQDSVRMRRGLVPKHTGEATGAQAERTEQAGEEADEEDEDAQPSAAGASGATADDPAAAPRRRYWVYTLLDSAVDLDILVQSNSLWYRYPGAELGLKYPLKFENMRYFVRIYQKKKPEQEE